MWTIFALACTEGEAHAPREGGAVDGGAMDGGPVDGGGGDGGGEPTTACSEGWPLDTRGGQAWSWAWIGCCDAWHERTETRAGPDTWEGEVLWRIDEEGAAGGEGASTAWTATRWYRCDEVGVFLVAEDRTEQETYDGPGEIVHTVTRWSPPAQVLPTVPTEGAHWRIDSTRITETDDGETQEEVLWFQAEVLGRTLADTPAGLFWTWEVEGLHGLPPFYRATTRWAGPHGLVQNGSIELVATP